MLCVTLCGTKKMDEDENVEKIELCHSISEVKATMINNVGYKMYKKVKKVKAKKAAPKGRIYLPRKAIHKCVVGNRKVDSGKAAGTLKLRHHKSPLAAGNIAKADGKGAKFKYGKVDKPKDINKIKRRVLDKNKS